MASFEYNSKAPNAEFLFVQLKPINARTSPTYWHPTTVAVAKLMQSWVVWPMNRPMFSGNRFCHVGSKRDGNYTCHFSQVGNLQSSECAFQSLSGYQNPSTHDSFPLILSVSCEDVRDSKSYDKMHRLKSVSCNWINVPCSTWTRFFKGTSFSPLRNHTSSQLPS